MSDSDKLEAALARLGRVEDRMEIADLVYRYTHAVRREDAAEFDHLFTEDGVFHVLVRAADGSTKTNTLCEGKKAIMEFMVEMTRSHNHPTPLVHNLHITLKGDEAESCCVMVGAFENGQPKFIGYYDDLYRREDTWRFTRRTYTMF
jgi:hypothetical protein